MWRIENEIKNAAKKKKVVHLWTHPHNFGAEMDKNMRLVENTFRVIEEYRDKNEILSRNMKNLVNKHV
jgi:hypothetical protein